MSLSKCIELFHHLTEKEKIDLIIHIVQQRQSKVGLSEEDCETVYEILIRKCYTWQDMLTDFEQHFSPEQSLAFVNNLKKFADENGDAKSDRL